MYYRYIPIHIIQTDYLDVNSSNVYTINFSTHLTIPDIYYNTTMQHKTFENTMTHIFLYIVLACMIISLTYILFLYSRHRYVGYTPIISMHKHSENLDALSPKYSYKGIAKILHELLIELRNKVSCRYCTPREVSFKLITSSLIKLFVSIYEDVVYGAKNRDDVYIVIEKVRENIIEKK